jgi:hypothetical protein
MVSVGQHLTRNDIAEIHEAIAANMNPAKSMEDQTHQARHLYAAKIIRENDYVQGGLGNKPFTHANRRAQGL